MHRTLQWWLVWLLGVTTLATTITLAVSGSLMWGLGLAAQATVSLWLLRERLNIGRTQFWKELQWDAPDDDGLVATLTYFWAMLGFGPLFVLFSITDGCISEGFEIRWRRHQVESHTKKRMKQNPQLVSAQDLEAHCMRMIEDSQSLLRRLRTELAAWEGSTLPTVPGERARIQREIGETEEAIEKYRESLETLADQITALKRETPTPTDAVVGAADKFQSDANEMLAAVRGRIKANQDLEKETQPLGLR